MVRSESGVGSGTVGFCPEQETGFLKVKLLVFSLAPGTLTAGGVITIEHGAGNRKLWSSYCVPGRLGKIQSLTLWLLFQLLSLLLIHA